MTESKARSTSSREDREVGATPLINSKNHGRASYPLSPDERRRLNGLCELAQPEGVPQLTRKGYELFWDAIFGSDNSDCKEYAVESLREYIAELEKRSGA